MHQLPLLIILSRGYSIAKKKRDAKNGILGGWIQARMEMFEALTIKANKKQLNLKAEKRLFLLSAFPKTTHSSVSGFVNEFFFLVKCFVYT